MHHQDCSIVAVCKVTTAPMKAEIAEVHKLSPSSIGFALKLAAATPLAFLPGQYVNVGVPGTNQTRSYSFSSMPKNGVVEFLVRNIPGRVMSSYLDHKAAPGDAVTITGLNGSFYLRDIKRPLLFLAGGTGLAPFLVMLEVIRSAGTPHPIHLICGVNTDADLVKIDTLAAFATDIPDFTYATVVVSTDSAHPRKGYVTQHMDESILKGGDIDIYLCGPPPMVDAVRTFLTQKGVKPTNFYFEKFSPSEKAA